jgi:hypothetical protein
MRAACAPGVEGVEGEAARHSSWRSLLIGIFASTQQGSAGPLWTTSPFLARATQKAEVRRCRNWVGAASAKRLQ